MPHRSNALQMILTSELRRLRGRLLLTHSEQAAQAWLSRRPGPVALRRSIVAIAVMADVPVDTVIRLFKRQRRRLPGGEK